MYIDGGPIVSLRIVKGGRHVFNAEKVIEIKKKKRKLDPNSLSVEGFVAGKGFKKSTSHRDVKR